MSTFFIKEYNNVATSQSLEYRHNILMGSSISAIVAGSDTTRASLIRVWYYLCKCPDHIDRVYDEVRNVNVDNVQELAHLPHLNAIIKETLRLAPPAMPGRSEDDWSGRALGRKPMDPT
jgi:cytochrome P450